jgi:signal transduction histidine kinase
VALCTVDRVNRTTASTLARDLGLWVGLGALVALESGARGDSLWVPGACLLVLAVAIGLRRVRPLVALASVGGLVAVILLVSVGSNSGVPIAMVPAMSLLSYLAGRGSSRIREFALLMSWGLLVFLILGLTLRRDLPVEETVLDWLFITMLALVFVVLPWFTGRYRTQRALLTSAGWDRAERIEREQQMRVEQARLRERSRIAEDMHDSVGHELSLIALRAAALEVDADLPARHRAAATELRQAAATATERLGEIIGVLREGESGAPVVPVQETVPDLVDRAAASGLAVRLVQEGSGELSPMVDRAAHRVVQEALTNASKHAPGAGVTVTVSHRDDAVTVKVTDTGATRLGPDGVPSSGRGLAGLTERVRLVGGTLTAGPRPGGGFELSARMPRTGGRPEADGPVPTVSAAAAELATVRRTARRGLITAIAAPLALGTALGAVAVGYYLIVGYNSILRPQEYELLWIGQSLDEVEDALPAMQMIDPPQERVPAPAHSTCRFYRPDGPFSITYAYRLCFVGDRLVAKDVVRTGSVEPTIEPTPK